MPVEYPANFSPRGKFTVKVRKLYEKIDEVEMGEDYEFLTEDCMRELGWSERPGHKILYVLAA